MHEKHVTILRNLYALGLMLFAGILLGIADANHATLWNWEFPLYILLAATFSLHRPRLAWLGALTLSVSLTLVHAVAFTCGYRYPYVEKDLISTLCCLGSFFITGFGAILGLMARRLGDGAWIVWRRKAHDLR